jgi:hypothetical protein
MKRPMLILCAFVLPLAMAGQRVSRDTLPAAKSLLHIAKEPRFYVNFHAGYSLALGSTFKFYPDDITSINVFQVGNNPPVTSTTYTSSRKGLGTGFRMGAGLSYIINDFVNVGLDFDYLSSTISKTRDSNFRRTEIMTATVDEEIFQERHTISYDATLITLTPHVTFKAISRPKFFIYNKIGAVITFRPNSIQNETTESTYKMGWQGFYRDSSVISSKRYEWGIQNPALGFMGGIGAQFRLNERWRAFGEFQFSHILFVIRNRMLTNFIVNGEDVAATLPLSAREVEFRKTLSSSDLNGSVNEASKAVTQRFPVTYVGFQSGIAYRF